jgi:transcriptional regulator with XRE-family HTH domain
MQAAELLRQARTDAGLTQRELANRAGVPQPAIARIESGGVSPRVDTLDRLLAACGRQISHAPAGSEVDPQDWAQAQDMLRRTPAQRLRYLESAARSIMALRRAAYESGMRRRP